MGAESDLVVEYGKMLIKRGLTRGTGGNVSVLNREDGLFAISPSGMDYFSISAEDVPLVELTTGKVVSSGSTAKSKKPSSEMELHRLLYLRRKDVNAVVHTHSPFAAALSCVREIQQRGLPAVHYLAAFAGERLRCVEYIPFGTPELADAVSKCIGGDSAVLLGNHGLVAVGDDMARAFGVAEQVEFACELYCRAVSAGTPVELTSAQVSDAVLRIKGYGR